MKKQKFITPKEHFKRLKYKLGVPTIKCLYCGKKILATPTALQDNIK